MLGMLFSVIIVISTYIKVRNCLQGCRVQNVGCRVSPKKGAYKTVNFYPFFIGFSIRCILRCKS